MPRQVLISETASAPPSSAARAIAAMSVTLGVSLARIGSEQAPRTPATTASAGCRIGAEIHAAADVWAGDVQFQGGDAGQAVQPGGQLDELLVALPGDADDDRRAQAGQVGQLPLR